MNAVLDRHFLNPDSGLIYDNSGNNRDDTIFYIGLIYFFLKKAKLSL